MKAGNRAAVFEVEMGVGLFHCNTVTWCCTSFVNLGNPLETPDPLSPAPRAKLAFFVIPAKAGIHSKRPVPYRRRHGRNSPSSSFRRRACPGPDPGPESTRNARSPITGDTGETRHLRHSGEG